MSTRRRYRFLYRRGQRYFWESVLPISPGDSRHAVVWCDVDWFWGRA